MKQGRLRRKTLATCVDLAYPILIELAKKGDTVTYGELVDLMRGRPGTRCIGEVLDRIAELERRADHPKLTAVVIRADTQAVGGGFLALPNTPKKLRRKSSEERRNHRLSADDWSYWQQQRACVYRHYQSPNPPHQTQSR